MSSLRNKINTALLFISAFIVSHKAFAEDLDIGEIDEIEINHDNLEEVSPEGMPELPQVQDVEQAVEQSASAMSQIINEHNLIVAVVVLACIVVALLIVIIYSFFQRSQTTKPKKNKKQQSIANEGFEDSKDLSGAVKSFLTRTNTIH